jgi:hypothetical protein
VRASRQVLEQLDLQSAVAGTVLCHTIVIAVDRVVVIEDQFQLLWQVRKAMLW